ncbi:hypothetical protein Pint_35173 [Pistacia integerrima]|uniref:Uncharacterized protein n=1 Tax=Pistacia integerrima TaxID=434235 RepID=A0ACC0Y4J8_9ROSI|nr:hypothetical protein Pint_35173 [Pistacia integerrima]
MAGHTNLNKKFVFVVLRGVRTGLPGFSPLCVVCLLSLPLFLFIKFDTAIQMHPFVTISRCT